MASSFWILFVLFILVLLYNRASLIIFAIAITLFFAFHIQAYAAITGNIVLFLLDLFVIFLAIRPLRRRLFSYKVLSIYRKIMPRMSDTEKEAIDAGTVEWEGDLFKGNPDWHKFINLAPAKLSAEELAFLEGPVNELCEMIDDWQITHVLADLPPAMWQFIKDKGFFALIIPKKFGGKEFSAYAHSQILVRISGKSVTVSSTIAVPNSLGPAELLLHYGTEDQKNYYLPRLARGEEVPCFALTSPDAGSDAGAMHDHGVVCRGNHEGKTVVGFRLNWNKRYITLAPIATVIGLAFKAFDPDHILSSKENLGITCALVPRNTPGVEIGRRHFPMNTPFQNGPTQGKDVFIPLDYVIGGAKNIGHGWRMLMECLAAGRAISLPASALGGAKVASYATGAYARIRTQFNLPIGKFEGVQAPLSRIALFTYIMDAARTFAARAIDSGAKPSVASAIVKYHVTELGRHVSLDSMDIHGGKGICLGPLNYLARAHEATPIAITVEGANILTRNMIIYGQGSLRCHPYVLKELQAANEIDHNKALRDFDQAFMAHAGFFISNCIRSFLLAITSSLIVQVPRNRLKRYYQHTTRMCTVLALFSDTAMLMMGSELKRKESLSARLGDCLSFAYLLSGVLKQFHSDGEPQEDYLLVKSCCDYLIYQQQKRLQDILANFPNRAIALLLRALAFPFGFLFKKPKDRVLQKIASQLIDDSKMRERLAKGAYLASSEQNLMTQLQDALLKVILSEPIEKKIRAAAVEGLTIANKAQAAFEKNFINEAELKQVLAAEAARQVIIAVDDFAPQDLMHGAQA